MNGVEYLILQDHADNPQPQKEEKKTEKAPEMRPEEEAKKEATKVEAKKEEKMAEPKEKPKREAGPEPKKTDGGDIHEEIRKLKEELRGHPEPAKPVVTPAPKAETQPALSGEEKAASLGLPTIVIDPGHGGKDPGASGLKGKVREKDVILAISKQLGASLKRKLGAKVFFTRANDTFITLGDRDRIANKRQADFFISIHANASTNAKAQGVEVYYLNKATDEASRRLAKRENEGAPKQESEMEAIVSDLLQTAATEESAELAEQVRKTFARRLQKKHQIEDIGVKTALFYVLVGAKCPSLLIETGFVTNPAEGKRLTKPAFQKDMADAIASAVGAYWKRMDDPGSDL